MPARGFADNGQRLTSGSGPFSQNGLLLGARVGKIALAMLDLILFSAVLAALLGLVEISFHLKGSAPASDAPVAPAHLAPIDGLRGLLATSVLIHHATCLRTWHLTGSWKPASPFFNNCGSYAVTMFFFITGFLFWSKLQRNPRPPLVPHLRSRIARLGPAYWTSTALMLFGVAGITGWTLHEPFRQVVLKVADWFFFTLHRQTDVNGLENTHHLDAGVTWTLRLEWVFYLLVPFCGWFAGRLWKTVLFIGLAFLLRVVAAGVMTIETVPFWIRMLLDQFSLFLACYFGGGIITAVLLPTIRKRFAQIQFTRPVFSALALSVAIAGVNFMPKEYGAAGAIWFLVPFALTALGNDWFGLLTSQPMLLLGKISYSLYLLHGFTLYMGLALAHRIDPALLTNPFTFWLLVIAIGGTAIALSSLWYRWFEAPFMPSKQRSPAVVSFRSEPVNA
jgi:peptidoglycan/LPS O-acetylase OafA/YrhL